jgi:hypothetical protein
MRCPRCNKRVNRKQWKIYHDCVKCKYNSNITDSKFAYCFPTNSYAVFVDKENRSFVYKLKSKNDIFVCWINESKKVKLTMFDVDTFIFTINKKISPKADDYDIEKLIMLT